MDAFYFLKKIFQKLEFCDISSAMRNKYYQSANVTVTDVTDSGTTTPNLIAVSLAVTGGSNATIAGATFKPGEKLVLEHNGPYNSVAYDATGTTIRIVEVDEA